MGPLNYSLDVLSPMQRAMGGYFAGVDRREEAARMEQQAARQARADQMAEARFANDMTLFDQGQQDRVAQQRAEAEMAARQAAFQADIQALDGTAQSYHALAMKYPEMAEGVREAWDDLEEIQQTSMKRTLGQTLAYINSGNSDKARDVLKQQADALRNSGDKETADMIDAYIGMDDGVLKDSLAMMAASLGFDEFDNFLGDPEPLSPEGKLAADIKAGLVDPSAAEPKADFKTVSEMRKEFSGLQTVKDFRDQASAYGRVIDSASNPSAAGDLALIFNFMKVLDPGSVVRESEFATAESASAWLQEAESTGVSVPRPIASAIRQIATGQRLSTEQRGDFVGRSKSLYDGAERQFDEIYNQYTGIAERNGLPVEDALIDYRYVPSEAGQGSKGSAGQPGSVVLLPQDQALFDKYANPAAQ